jgi:integrase
LNTYVARAVSLPLDGSPMAPDGVALLLPPGVRESALPSGFPFLVDAASGEVIEPVLLWLLSEHLSNSRIRWVKNTALAQCDDLKDFYQYIDAAEVGWNMVDEADLVHYRDTMESIISRKTHEGLSPTTIRRRLVHVLAFYDWARSAGYYEGPEFNKREVRRLRRIDEDALAHTRSGRQTISKSALPPAANAISGAQARPFRESDLRHVLNALGPLSSRREEKNGHGIDHRPSRDRLAGELGVVAGLRVDEVASLQAHQILDLCPHSWDSHDLGAAVVLHLTNTKGLRPRPVFLPTWLLRELDLYIRGERAEAMELATQSTRRRRKPTTALFVNGARARANAGKKVTTDTLHDTFHRAVLDAGLVEHVVKTDPLTRKQRLEKEAKHSFHDLRHTFAVQTYWHELRQGNPAPWKIVQSRLGHKNLATTMKYYLAVVDAFEAAVSDRMFAVARSIAEDRDNYSGAGNLHDQRRPKSLI